MATQTAIPKSTDRYFCFHEQHQARLRLESSFTNLERSERVQTVIRQMGPKKCENTLIGTPGFIQGISGGEKKRLSVASEVNKVRPLLFL